MHWTNTKMTEDELYSYGLNVEWFVRPWAAIVVGASRQEAPYGSLDDTKTRSGPALQVLGLLHLCRGVRLLAMDRM